MKWFIYLLKGLFIGCGAILPGVSSGVLCVVFGLYDKLVDSILHFFKNWKENLFFLLPIFLGTGIGIVLFSNVVKFLFYTYPVPTKFTFIGLILGCIPFLLKKANTPKVKWSYLLFFFISFILSFGLILLENSIHFSSYSNHTFFYFLLGGLLMSAGIVIPGVSSTVILILYGIYGTYLNAISSLNFSVLFPMGIGVFLGSIFLLKLIHICFKKFSAQTYYAIIGFVTGSIFVLYEPIFFNFQGLLAIAFLFLGMLVGKKMS